jgi:hypothetical protein
MDPATTHILALIAEGNSLIAFLERNDPPLTHQEELTVGRQALAYMTAAHTILLAHPNLYNLMELPDWIKLQKATRKYL